MDKIKKFFNDRRTWAVAASVAVMALIALFFFFPDDISGNILSQHDTRQGIANGQEVEAYLAAHPGEDVRWTNSLFGGMPTFQIAPSYPSNSMFSWIGSVMTLGLPSPADLLFLMMVGFFILLMVMKMRWGVALLGAIAYGFSSYFIIIIGAGHIWKFVTLAYVPPTIAGIVLAYRGRYLAGAAVAGLFAMMQIASNHVQMTYYFLFVVAGFAVAYLIEAVRNKKVGQWAVATGCLAVAGLLAVAANLPSLYNTYEYSKETIRGGHSELTKPGDAANATSGGLDRDYLTAYSYGGVESLSLLIPDIKGGATNRPVAGQNMIVALGQLDAASEMASNGEISAETAYYLQQLPQYFGEPEGTNGPVYVGALICALFLVGCIIVRGPLKWVLVVLTIFSILLALGRNCMWLTDLMIDYMPMYNKFRTPESILVIAEFTMPLLAVMGLQKLLELPGRESWDRYRKAILAGFGITCFFCLVGILAPALYGSGVTDMEKEMGISRMPELYHAMEQLRYGMVRSDALRSLLFIALGFGALMLYFRKVVTVGVTVLFVGLVTAADLLTVNKRYLNSDSFMPAPLTNDEVFVASPADQAILTDTAMNYRVLDMKRFMSAEPSYYHKAIGGYHAAKLTRYQDMLEYFFLSGEHNPDNMLNMLNTRYIIQDPQQMPSINIGAMGNAWLVDKLDYVDTPDAEIAAVETLDLEHNAVADRRYESVLGKAQPKLQGDTIFETSYAPNRLTYHVDTKHGGVAVFSEVYFPWGWHATIDGKPAELGRVNYILRALRVPSGSHTIEMWFDPESLHTTTTIARVAIIGIYLLIVAAVATGLIRRIKKPTDDKPTDGSETLEV